jgi:hypothetical protein
MTKKDYELIARNFRTTMATAKRLKADASAGMILVLANSLAADLAIDNPRFNRETFLSACGIAY